MTTWDLYCAIHFAEPGTLTVLGPKCRTADCLEPARFTVWWPGSAPILCCARCTDGWRRVADRGFGMALAVTPLHYTTGEDDAVQRFRMMELT